MTANAIDTLRDALDKPWCPNLGSCPPEMHSGCSYCAAHEDALAALARVDTLLQAAKLVEAHDQAGGNDWWLAHAKLYAAVRAVETGQ